MPSLPPKNKIWSILVKDPLKIDIELFPWCAISHVNQSFSQIFFCACSVALLFNFIPMYHEPVVVV